MRYLINHEVVFPRSSEEADENTVAEVLARYLAKLAPNYGQLTVERTE